MFWPPVPAKAQFITRAVPAGLAWTLGAGAGGVALIAFLAAVWGYAWRVLDVLLVPASCFLMV